MSKMTDEQAKRLETAISRLADRIDGGHLLAATDPAQFIYVVIDEIDRLRTIAGEGE